MITSKNPVSVSVPCEGSARFYVGTCSKTEAGALIMRHGLSKHPLYVYWSSIKYRCLNPKCKEYKHYGGRGIFIYSKWIDDPQAFYDYISSLPDFNKPGLTLDRIKNNQGYKPGNLRWVDKHIQSTNRSMHRNNSSGYVGVVKAGPKFKACIGIKWELIYLGTFVNPIDAAITRDQYIIDNELWEYKLQVLPNPNHNQ